MWPVVPAAFVAFSDPYEGTLPFMYLDRKGLVTCAVGIKCDPLSDALPLPWQTNGRPSTRDEIAASWSAVKAAQSMAPRGGAAFGSLPGNVVRLTPQGILDVTGARLLQFEAHLKTVFPAWETWPADAQLGALSLAWSVGPNYDDPNAAPNYYPHFIAACNARDWAEAGKQSHISAKYDNAVARRNAAQVALFANAEKVDSEGLEPSALLWPARSNKVPGAGGAVVAIAIAGLGAAGYYFASKG